MVTDWCGAKMAVEHLIALGRRPVVHIAGPSTQTMCKFRRGAFEQIMSDTFSDITPNERIFTVSAMTPDEGYAVMPGILSALQAPLSLFVVNDDTALGVLRYCNEKKLRIPEDMAIIGFSDIELIDSLKIPLSTVRIPAEDMGVKAATLIIDAIESKQSLQSERIVLPVELIVRGSTHL